MRKFDEKWPYKTKKLFELIENQTDGNATEFANMIGVDQQRINRLFLINKKSGDFPRMSKDLESAIREVIDLPLDYFMPPPVEVEVNPIDYLFLGKKERFNKAYNFLKNEGIVKKQEDVARAMRESTNNISGALSGREMVLTDNFLTRFATAFKQISLKWLLDGEGEMLNVAAPEFKSENTPQVLEGDADKDIVEEQAKMTARIIELMRETSHIPKTFALESDIEVSLFLSKLNGKKVWSVADVHKICDTFRVRKGWLVDGDGQKYRLPDEVLEKMPVRRSYDKNVGRPYYNVDFEMGYDLMSNDQTVNPEYMIDISPYNKCDCWCNARGDSMSPTISNGDKIAIKEISDPQKCLINDEIYAIVTTNGLRTIKRIRDNGDSLTLIPDNKSYSEQTISKSLILKVYKVLGSVKTF